MRNLNLILGIGVVLLAMGSGEASAFVFRHEVWGRAVYGDGYIYGPTSRTEAVEVIDFDADGDYDFVLPPVDSELEVLRNLGSSAAFFPGGPRRLNVNPPPDGFSLYFYSTFSDVTGNGLPDLFAQWVNYADGESRIVWYRNQGPRDNPAYAYQQTLYTSGQTNFPLGPMKLADLNGDGLEDLLFLEYFLDASARHHRLFLMTNTGTPTVPQWGPPVELTQLSNLMPPRHEVKDARDPLAKGLVVPAGKQLVYIPRVSDIEFADWDVSGTLDFMFYDVTLGVDWVRNLGTATGPVWEPFLNAGGTPPYRHRASLGAVGAAFAVRPAPTARTVSAGIQYPDFYVALDGRVLTWRYNIADHAYDLFHSGALGFYFGFGPVAFWDYDGDGTLDLFAAADVGNGWHQLTIVPNVGTPYLPVWSDEYEYPQDLFGNGIFMSAGTPENSFRSDQFTFSDLEGDGVQWFLVQGQDGTITRYLPQQAGFPFTNSIFTFIDTDFGGVTAPGDINIEPRGLAVANFDAVPGYPEAQILAAYSHAHGARLIFSDPYYGAWRDMSDNLPDPSGAGTLNPDLIESMAAADVDRDGRPDLVVSLSKYVDYSLCTHHVYRNAGRVEGVVQFEYAGQLDEVYDTDTFGARMVALADIDADTTPDLFISHLWYSPAFGMRVPWLRFYRNTSDTGLEFWRTRVVSGQNWDFTIDGEPAQFEFIHNASGGSLFQHNYTAGPQNRVVDIIQSTNANPNYRVFIDVLPPVGPESKAILVLGAQADDTLYPVFEYLTQYAFNVLTLTGMDPANIRMFAPTAIDGTLDGVSNTFAAPTLAGLQSAVTQWAQGSERLLVYLVDHGRINEFPLNAEEQLPSGVYASWLDALQSGASPPQVTTVIDTCDAGTFIGPLATSKDLHKNNAQRITIAGAGIGPIEGVALFDQSVGLSFSLSFWGEILNGGSYGRAFDIAKVFIQAVNPLQTPLIDDNGNGVANESGDGGVARQARPGADFEQPTPGVFIGDVAPTQAVSSNSATLWLADVVSTYPVLEAGALIVGPDFNRGISETDDEQPVTGLEFLELELNPQTNRYEGVFSGFNVGGLYRILYYVNAGGQYYTAPTVGFVDRVGIPDAWEPNNSPAQAKWLPVNTVQGHNFHAQADVDWLRFTSPPSGPATVAVLAQGPACQPVAALYRKADLDANPAAAPLVTRSADRPNEDIVFEYTFSSSEQYLLKISNTDPQRHGEGTSYLALVAVGTGNVIPPTLAVTVLDAQTGALLDNATVTAEGGGGTFNNRTTPDGVTQFTLPGSGSYTLSAVKNGYSRQSSQVLLRKHVDDVTLRLNPTGAAGNMDINQDGRVNAVDIQLTINGALGIAVEYNTDVNGDGSTNAVDIQLVINAVLTQ